MLDAKVQNDKAVSESNAKLDLKTEDGVRIDDLPDEITSLVVKPPEKEPQAAKQPAQKAKPADLKKKEAPTEDKNAVSLKDIAIDVGTAGAEEKKSE